MWLQSLDVVILTTLCLIPSPNHDKKAGNEERGKQSPDGTSRDQEKKWLKIRVSTATDCLCRVVRITFSFFFSLLFISKMFSLIPVYLLSLVPAFLRPDVRDGTRLFLWSPCVYTFSLHLFLIVWKREETDRQTSLSSSCILGLHTSSSLLPYISRSPDRRPDLIASSSHWSPHPPIPDSIISCSLRKLILISPFGRKSWRSSDSWRSNSRRAVCMRVVVGNTWMCEMWEDGRSSAWKERVSIHSHTECSHRSGIKKERQKTGPHLFSAESSFLSISLFLLSSSRKDRQQILIDTSSPHHRPHHRFSTFSLNSHICYTQSHRFF